MVNRVLLNQSGLKISRSGIDVLTASASDLLFSSKATGFKLLQRGTISVRSLYPGSPYSYYQQDISLPKTFSTQPLILMEGQGYSSCGLGYAGISSVGAGGSTEWYLGLKYGDKSKLEFYQFDDGGYAEIPVWPYTLNYAILDWL